MCLSGCGKTQDTEPAAPVSEYSTIELSGEKHLISDPNSKYEYEIDSSFKATESHAAEVSVLSVYAPDKDAWNESDLPRVYLLSDEWISYAIEEFKEKGGNFRKCDRSRISRRNGLCLQSHDRILRGYDLLILH